MIEQRIEQIKGQLRELMRQIAAMNEEPPPEVQQLIMQVMEKAQREIQQLREQQGQEQENVEQQNIEQEQAQAAEQVAPQAPEVPPPSIPVPPLMPAPYQSSNINAFRYDPKTERLFVKFQGKYPAQNGPVYAYDGIPESIYKIFRQGAVAPRTSGRNAWHRWRRGVTPSLGAAMHSLIKSGAFPYMRVQ